jgi:prophage regulatory protein
MESTGVTASSASTAPVLLRLPEVMARTKLSRSELYRRMAIAKFPAPVKLGVGSRWVEGEVNRWIADLVAQRDAKAAAA